MCINHKDIYGQTIDLCTMKCRGGVGSGLGGLSQKVHHRLYQPTPPTKWSDSKSLDADKVLEFKAFSREKPAKRKKKERKNVQDTSLAPLLINVLIFYLISDSSSMKHEVA